MRIDKLEINNFRCFEHLKLDTLHPNLNVFVGTNGSGKTSLLRAIKLCLGTYVSQFSDIDASEKQKMYISSEDVRIIKYGEFAKQTQFYCEVEFHKKKYSWKREKIGRTGKSSSKERDIGVIKNLVLELEDKLKRPDYNVELMLPIIAYFSTDRVSADRKYSPNKLFSSRLRGYFNSLGDVTNIEYLKEWLKDRQLAKFQHSENKSPALELLQKVIKNIPNISGIEYIIGDFDSTDSMESDIYLIHEDGKKEGFNFLSDGYKMYVTLLIDLAMRCFLLNPQEGSAASENTSGIVLIDEIDLHLHPSWQRIVIPTLRSAFPKIQFFITTHSPQVISSIPKESLYTLNSGTIQKSISYTQGRDSNSILSDIFDIQKRPVKGQQKLDDFYAYLNNKDLDSAQKALEHLELIWGDLDAEVVRANLYFQDLHDEMDSQKQHK
jgi:predicted ATP-binding protein involved in virulence